MTTELPKHLQELDDLLLGDAFGDDAMLLSELDGFLAGLAVGPALIMPAEWLPAVWGEDGPSFEDERQAQDIIDRIMGHYNGVIGQLEHGDYRPIYDIDIDGSAMWMLWIEGFWRAVSLRIDDWLAFGAQGDEDLQRAVFTLTRLHEITSTPSAELEAMAIDGELEASAPDLIPDAVLTLHRTRLGKAGSAPRQATARSPKVGRNDPCPCGSGKKFKKCCLH